jgi:hypothetical protein
MSAIRDPNAEVVARASLAGESRMHPMTVVVDIVALACGITGLVLLVAGPYRGVWGETGVSVRWTHVLFVAVALAVVRHVAVPRPALTATLAGWLDRIRSRPALADAAVAFWFTRPVVVLVGFLAVAAIGVPPAAQSVTSTRHILRDLPARYDANWYAGIAADGYDWQHRFDRQQNLAFFPAYPMLMRAAGVLTGAFRSGMDRERRITRFVWAGLLVSLAAFFWAGWYFARIARDFMDADRACGALLLLAAYPFAVFYSAAYTESLFLLSALGAWWHLRRGQVGRGAIWGLLAGLARPNGFFLSLPFALLALGFTRGSLTPGVRSPSSKTAEKKVENRDQTPGGRPAFLAALMPVAGMGLFTLYLFHRTGVWFAWARVHGAWGRVLGSDLSAVSGGVRNVGLLDLTILYPSQALNAIGLAFALTLVWPVWRRLGPAWAGYVLVNIVPPFLAGGLLSMGRLSSTLFPLFLALAMVIPSRAVAPLAAAFALLQALVAALFYTWRHVY